MGSEEQDKLSVGELADAYMARNRAYGKVKANFTDAKLVQQMRGELGDEQVKSAVREGIMSFLESPEAEIVNSGGNRHCRVIEELRDTILVVGLEGYLQVLNEGIENWDGSQRRAWGWEDTMNYIRNRKPNPKS